MRLSEPVSTRSGDRQRISVLVEWEDCDRSDFELFFETDIANAAYLTSHIDPFLIASVAPAYRYGERRIRCLAPVCSTLAYNLFAVNHHMMNWHFQESPVVQIECELERRPARPASDAEAAQLFSGGIDSYATLALNRRYYRPGDPEYIRTGVLSFGLEQDDEAAFEHVARTLRPGTEALGLDLICVYSNVYLPYREEDRQESWRFWMSHMMGLGLSSQLHALGGRLSFGSISASEDPDHDLKRAGSSGLIDECTSSAALRILHSAGYLTRQEKVNLVAEDDAMLNHLRVCNQYRRYTSGSINCGRCEKCIRTRLQLLVAGALERCDAFGNRGISADEILDLKKIGNENVNSYKALIGPLEAAKRSDLSDAIRRRLSRPPSRPNPWLRRANKLRRKLESLLVGDR